MILLEVNLPVHNSCYSLLLVTNEILCHELVHITETLKIVVFEKELVGPALISNKTELVIIRWILKLIS